MSSSHDEIDDVRWMRLALREGHKGLGTTSPNPPVGAVIVKKGVVLGRGHHRIAGGPHAEIAAIRDAQSRMPEGKSAAAALRGATLYVTLEPCSSHGRTPPCTDAVLEHGFKRVVVGCADPDPRHGGNGLTILRKAGLQVTQAVLEKECRELIRYFAHFQATGLPWVIAKSAITLDGRTTRLPGQGQWISGQKSREDVQRLRRQMDAILVGGETVRKDNPRLTIRDPFLNGREVQPWRVVMTPSGNIPQNAHLLTDEFRERTIIVKKCSLKHILRDLAGRGVRSVIIESGGRLLGEALKQGVVNEVVFYIAPILGGGPTFAVDAQGVTAKLMRLEIKRFGDDIRVRGLL